LYDGFGNHKKTINQLSPTEFDEILDFMLQQQQGIRPPLIDEDPQTRIRELEKAFAEIRASMSPEELDEMIEIMNSEYIEPEEEFG
jgi:uncharacterized protein YeeX (DUF496 family)